MEPFNVMVKYVRDLRLLRCLPCHLPGIVCGRITNVRPLPHVRLERCRGDLPRPPPATTMCEGHTRDIEILTTVRDRLRIARAVPCTCRVGNADDAVVVRLHNEVGDRGVMRAIAIEPACRDASRPWHRWGSLQRARGSSVGYPVHTDVVASPDHKPAISLLPHIRHGARISAIFGIIEISSLFVLRNRLVANLAPNVFKNGVIEENVERITSKSISLVCWVIVNDMQTPNGKPFIAPVRVG